MTDLPDSETFPTTVSTRVRYIEEPNDEQVHWAACADPRALLTIGRVYEVERIEEHTWHTKVFLSGIDCGRGFNSISFRDPDREGEHEH